VHTFDQVMRDLNLRARPQQVKLSELLRSADRNLPVIVQAGTGVGKSYCVLSEAVQRKRATGKLSVVVCPTNALVDQYVSKDAPAVANVTGATFTHLKGRSNYLCADSAELSKAEDPPASYQELVRRHDSYELSRLGLDSREYGCPGSRECSGEACGALAAREAAVNFDVVITNAHVLAWDKRIRSFTEGSYGLLPHYGALLVDECHELESSLRSCLSDEIRPGSTVYTYVPGFKSWVLSHTRDLDDEVLFSPDDECRRWCEQARGELAELRGDAEDAAMDSDFATAKVLRTKIAALERFCGLFDATDLDGTRFITTLTPDRTVRRICVDASLLAGDILNDQPSCLVSGTIPATLPRRLGTDRTPIHDVGHPFDYSKSVLVISRYGPRTRSDQPYRVDQLVRAIRETGGGTLVLFTSWQDLNDIMGMVHRRLQSLGVRIPILLQSRDDPADTKQMISEFAVHGNAVLAGVATLFTGIDIPGPALRQVVLWKLPYPVPSLEFQAIERAHGKQVYFDEMLIRLAQGIGRLVRTAQDSGRVLILDNRAKNQRWSESTMTKHLTEFASSGPPPVRALENA